MRITLILSVIGLVAFSPLAIAQKDETAGDSGATPAVSKSKLPEPVCRQQIVEIDGKKINYEVTAATMEIELGKESADIFYVSYERLDVEKAEGRPVAFAFNGGPGSSAVWLHIGMLGPRTLQLPGDGTEAPQGPILVSDNSHSLLDVCDLVFIDPVSTGYSRAKDGKNAKRFHGLDSDIESVGEFIRRWVTENDRWASPKHLIGESYGGIRAAGLAKFLQSRHGMTLSGLVLLSAILDYGTVSFPSGQDQAYSIFLPTYAAVAHHHGILKGDRNDLVATAKTFAYGDYASALIQGSNLPKDQKPALAAKLESFTGVSAETWLKHDLRIHPSLFRGELLRDSSKVLGRFDGRVAWDATDASADYANYDPSYSLALGAFSTAIKDYLGREIGYKLEEPYEILTGSVHPWTWNSDNSIVNVSSRLAGAMRDNPHLKVLVMSGYTDLATPPECVAYSLRHMHGLPEALRQNIKTVHYEAGHMFYLNPPDLEKSRKDLLEFLRSE